MTINYTNNVNDSFRSNNGHHVYNRNSIGRSDLRSIIHVK